VAKEIEKEPKFEESIHFRPGEKENVDVVLRDSITQELIGRSTIHLDQVKQKKGVYTEWFDLHDFLGFNVGRIMLELEWKHVGELQRESKQQPLHELVDVEDLIEDLRDSLSDMMLETNLMFHDITRRFFPDFSSTYLGFFDTPLWIQSGERKHRKRHRRSKKGQEIGQQQGGPEGIYQEKFPEVPQQGEQWQKGQQQGQQKEGFREGKEAPRSDVGKEARGGPENLQERREGVTGFIGNEGISEKERSSGKGEDLRSKKGEPPRIAPGKEEVQTGMSQQTREVDIGQREKS
jgi:hypothetical protein